MIASTAGLGFGFREIGGVTVNVEHHVTGNEAEDRIWKRSAVVKEACDSL